MNITGNSVLGSPARCITLPMAIRVRSGGSFCVDVTGWVDPVHRGGDPREAGILRVLAVFRDQHACAEGRLLTDPQGRLYVEFPDRRTAEAFAEFTGVDSTFAACEGDDGSAAWPAWDRRRG